MCMLYLGGDATTMIVQYVVGINYLFACVVIDDNVSRRSKSLLWMKLASIQYYFWGVDNFPSWQCCKYLYYSFTLVVESTATKLVA